MLDFVWRPTLLLLFALGIPGLAIAQESGSDPGQVEEPTESSPRQVPQQIKVEFSDGRTRPLFYLNYTPQSYSVKESPKPLLLFLHGRGECGNDLELVKKWGPPKLVQAENDFPFVVISPQCASPGWDVVALKGLVDHITNTMNVDRQRVYVSGLSMGGYGTWKFVANYPEIVAAAVPICGGGHAGTADKLKHVPIWAFHGDADSVVPISESRSIVEAVKEAGGEKIKLTIYEGVHHNSWVQTYANPEVYRWLLSQRRVEKDTD